MNSKNKDLTPKVLTPKVSMTPEVSTCGNHFRHWIQPIEIEIKDAVRRCDKDSFQRLVHQGQDTYVHTPKYSCEYLNGRFGHAADSIKAWLKNDTNLDPDNNPAEWLRANEWTKGWVKQFRENCECGK